MMTIQRMTYCPVLGLKYIDYCVNLLAVLHLLQINSVLEYHYFPPLEHRCMPNFEALIRHKHRGETVLVPLRTVVAHTV